jgi:hypothetical protein
MINKRPQAVPPNGAQVCAAPNRELHGHAILRSGANTAADLIPADHQIAAVLCLAADQKMRMRIVGVVVVNRNPVELGAEISLHVGDELPRRRP